MKFVTTTRSGEQRIFETAPEVKYVLGRPRSRWKNKVVPETGKELQANLHSRGEGGGRRITRRRW
jgi:hypothetical protein